jgi:hypothetical protein
MLELSILMYFLVYITNRSIARIRRTFKRAGLTLEYPMMFGGNIYDMEILELQRLYNNAKSYLSMYSNAYAKLSPLIKVTYEFEQTRAKLRITSKLKTLLKLLENIIEPLEDFLFALDGAYGPDKDEISARKEKINTLISKIKDADRRHNYRLS